MHPWSREATKLAGQLRRSAEASAAVAASYAPYEHLNLSDWSASPPDEVGDEASAFRIPDFPEGPVPDVENASRFREIGDLFGALRIDDFEIDGILQLVEGPCLGERARIFRAERLARKAEDAAAAAAAAEREAEFDRLEREVEAERAEARRKLEAIRQAERDRRAAAEEESRKAAEAKRKRKEAAAVRTKGDADAEAPPPSEGPAGASHGMVRTPNGDGRSSRGRAAHTLEARSRSRGPNRFRGDDYWAQVRVELGRVEAPAPRKWAPPIVVPAEPTPTVPPILAEIIDVQERLARARAAASGPSGPASAPERSRAARRPRIGKSAEVGPPVAACPSGTTIGMQTCFSEVPNSDLQALASRMSLSDETEVLETLLSQFRSTFPDVCRRRGISKTNPEFSDLVAAMMGSGDAGLRLLLLHDTYRGVAMIDVRCPRPQLVASWSRCIAAARSCLPPGRRPPPPTLLDKIANLRLGLRISELTRCLLDLDLRLVIGRTESA